MYLSEECEYIITRDFAKQHRPLYSDSRLRYSFSDGGIYYRIDVFMFGWTLFRFVFVLSENVRNDLCSGA